MANGRNGAKWLPGMVALCLMSSIVWAQSYPTKQVSIIVTWPPGRPSDTAARPMAKGLQLELGKPFVIGFFAPAQTPVEVIAKLAGAARNVMKRPEYQAVLAETGSELVAHTRASFRAFIRAEAEKWGKVAKETGATVD